MTTHVICQGTGEYRTLRHNLSYPSGKVPSAYVVVGQWQSQHIDGGAGLGNQEMGVFITGHCNHDIVYQQCLHTSKTVFQPDVRNKLGGLGAYHDEPPTQETIDATIADAVKCVDRFAAAGHVPGDCDCLVCQKASKR
jgi:hypothetical protein